MLVTEDVPDLPSYMKISKQLSDRSDLVAWARSVVAASSLITLSKWRETLATPTVPRVPHYRAAVPYRAQVLG